MSKKTNDSDKSVAVTIILGLLTNIEKRLDLEIGELQRNVKEVEKQLAYMKGIAYSLIAAMSIVSPIIYYLIQKFLLG